MPVFWDHHDILITDKRIVIGRSRLPLRDLTDLHTARGPCHPMAARAMFAGGYLLVAVVVAAPVIPAIVSAVAGGAALALLGLATAVNRLRPRPYLVVATIGAQQALLFSTRDTIEYGKFVRSLRRAAACAQPCLEHHTPAGWLTSDVKHPRRPPGRRPAAGSERRAGSPARRHQHPGPQPGVAHRPSASGR